MMQSAMSGLKMAAPSSNGSIPKIQIHQKYPRHCQMMVVVVMILLVSCLLIGYLYWTRLYYNSLFPLCCHLKMKFPDIHEIQSPEPSQSVAKQQQEAGLALLASSIVSQTFTSMMQSAMSGLKMAAPSSNEK
jgi:hypothetical protein